MKLLFLLLATLLLGSCATQQRCAIKYPCAQIHDTFKITHYHERIVKEHDTLIKRDTVTEKLTPRDVKNLPTGKWVSTPQAKNTNSQVKVLKDSLGNLYIECSGKDELIKRQQTEITELKNEKQKQTVVLPPVKQKCPVNHWLIFFGGVIVGAAIIIIFIYYLSKFFNIFNG